MSRVFEISAPAQRVRLGPDGRGEMVFSVTNRGTVLQRVNAGFAPSGATRAEWLSLAGEAQRELSAGATDQFIVHAQVPPGTAEGAYPFRLRVTSANNRTSEDYDESPLVHFEMPAVTAVKKKPWWIAAAAAALLAVVAVAAVLATRDRGVRVPDVTNREAVEAIRAIQAANLAVRLEFAPPETVEHGRVVRSQPPAGATVDEGAPVLLTIASSTPGTLALEGNDATQLSDATAQQLTALLTPVTSAEVPPVVGKAVVDAMILLQQRGLSAKLLTFTSAQSPPNVVLQQDPGAGAKIAPGAQVTLVIAQRPVFVAVPLPTNLSPALRRQLTDFNRRVRPQQ